MARSAPFAARFGVTQLEETDLVLVRYEMGRAMVGTNRRSTLGERMSRFEPFRGSGLLQRMGLAFGWNLRL